MLETIKNVDKPGRRTASIRARGEVECLSVTVSEMLLALDQDEVGSNG